MIDDRKPEPALPRSGSEWFGEAAEQSEAALPAPVQEHLAQQLRAAYHELAEKPAFLGDPTLPPQIEQKIGEMIERERSAVREKVHELGTEAVEAALEEVVAGGVTPEELAPKPAAAGKRPRMPTRS